MMGSDDISRLLAAERAAAPPAGNVDAGLERLLTSMAAHAAPLPVAVGSLQLGWSLFGKWLGVGFAVGLTAAGAATVASSGQSEVRPAAPVVSAAPTPVATVAQASEATLPKALVEPRLEPRSLHQPALPSAAASVEQGPTFDEELKLIAAAKRELDAGKPHLARVWLDDHARRFAGGVFALEREGLLVLARCAQAPSPALARDFATRYPSSPLREQLTRRCGTPASPGPLPSAVDFPSAGK